MRPKILIQFPFLCLVAGLATLLSACSPSKSSASQTDSNVDYYTCTMHPSVHSHDPNGKCPICGMDLVPMTNTAK